MVAAAAISLVVAAAISLVVAAAISPVVAAAISLVVAAISPGSPDVVLTAITSANIEESALPGTEIISGIISGTKIISGSGIISAEISLLEIPLRMITRTTGSTIRTTAMITTMLVTIPMDNPHHRK